MKELKDPGVIKFTTKLLRPDGVGTGTFFFFPFDTEELFGTKSNVKVEITIDGYKYRGLLANMGDPHHCVVVRKEIRDAVNKNAGEEVDVTIKLDTAPRVVEIPDDVNAEFKSHPSEQEYFKQLSYSHQKEYIEWIVSSKKPMTRATRIAKMVDMLKEKKKLK